MSKPVVITVDSTADLSAELLARYDIKTVPLTIILGDDSYADGVDFTPDMIYERYRSDGVLPKTAAPGVQALLDFFSGFTSRGYEVVHLDISAELSNIFNSARLAAAELEGVYVVDSRLLSTGIALLALEAAECRDAGMCAGDIAARLERLREKVSVSFVLDNLEFMWKGGRCSGFTALGANALKLRPALEMKDGKLGVYKKYRGCMPKVYEQYVSDRLAGKKIRPGHVFVTESGGIDPALTESIISSVKRAAGRAEVHHTKAGATVSSHCGPGTLGVHFIEE